MPLPESDKSNPAPPAPDHGGESPPTPNTGGAGRRGAGRAWLWALLGLIVGVPALLTLISMLTSPPHVAGVPVGRLLYLDADQPSEKTTMLRGLYIAPPGGSPRLLLHETEPQDTDAGAREWFLYPTASPDGRQVAFEKQLITIQDEKQSVINQLWAMPLDDPRAKPRLLLDLTKRGWKQIVGLAWTAGGSDVMLLEDGTEYSVSMDGAVTQSPLAGLPPLKLMPDISATRSPFVAANGVMAYSALTPTGTVVIVGHQRYPDLAAFALSPDGQQLAFVPAKAADKIYIADARTGKLVSDIAGRWGWSAFGSRHITSLRWSPDGKYLAYTVSKPPVPEEELFYADLATGTTRQLPVRTGRAAWDWAR